MKFVEIQSNLVSFIQKVKYILDDSKELLQASYKGGHHETFGHLINSMDRKSLKQAQDRELCTMIHSVCEECLQSQDPKLL